MVETFQIGILKNGELELHPSASKDPEAVLALPLRRFVAKVLFVPQDAESSVDEMATAAIKEMSPFPDENPTVSVEILTETEAGKFVLAAALPESSADDIAEMLDAAKKQVTRIDATVLGVLRNVWGEISAPGRRIVLVAEDGDAALAVFDGELLASIRAVSPGADLRREAIMGLLEAEDLIGPGEVEEVVAVGEAGTEGLESFGAVRRIDAPAEETVLGTLSERALEQGTMDPLPETWREVLRETRFKKKLKKHLVVAGVVWALAMGGIFGVPAVYGFMTDRVAAMSKEHSRRYREVSEMRDKVRLVRKYSDHARGLLEVMKAVSDRLPDGVELTSWNFRREEGVKFSGEADAAPSVYEFKDKLSDIAFVDGDGDGDKLFAEVSLTGPSAGRGGRQRFDMDCRFIDGKKEGSE